MDYCVNCGFYPKELGHEGILKNTELGVLLFCNEDCYEEWLEEEVI